jgi:uncharacterized membrane protein YfcA
VIGAILIGAAAGVVAGLLGVGGGVLFVPGLVIFLGLTQHEAEATSLLAIIPVALVGALRQDRYGNVRRRDGALLGLFSVAGAAGGVAVANALSGKALQVAFAVFTLVVAEELVRKTLRDPAAGAGVGVDQTPRARAAGPAIEHTALTVERSAPASPPASPEEARAEPSRPSDSPGADAKDL